MMQCWSAVILLMYAQSAAGDNTGASGKRKPHILFLLADDMGWANIGYHRRGAATAEERQGKLEVQTPTIDSLADDGIVLDRHYSYRICGPARAALLSGRLGPHVLNKNVAVTAINKDDPVSGFSGIPRNMTGLGMKMKAGGYKTYYTGKWDAGMATPQHTPRGRGFDGNFIYYQHANDYWNKKTGIQATGEVTACLNSFYDLMIENDTYRGPYKGSDLTDACKESEEPTPSCYEEKMFEERSLEIIRNHDASDVEHPLFLFHAFHLLHTPLQVPKYYYEQIQRIVTDQGGSPFDSNNRRLLMAMTRYLDDTIRNLTDALKAKGMWEDTLVVFTTDNGGPIYEPGSSNNYPLKGGKYSDFEGGVRTNTFMSGGFIPRESRSRIHEGIVSIADWYYMFSELAGVDPRDLQAEEANKWLSDHGLPILPPIDGKAGQLDAIFKGTKGPRADEPLLISSTALLDYPFKLVTGKQPYMSHQGPLFPNCSTIKSFASGHGPFFVDVGVFEYKPDFGDEMYWRGDCQTGCLYDLENDPSESIDLSMDPAYKGKLEYMINYLSAQNHSLFMPERGETHYETCESVMLNGGGHFGPFAFADGYYTDKPRKISDLSLKEKLQLLEMRSTENMEIKELLTKYGVPVLKLYLEKFGDKCSEDDFNEFVANNGISVSNFTSIVDTIEAALSTRRGNRFSAVDMRSTVFV
eukprot:TRINITY_DN1171_c0_g4_i1.p1 TRINITY_DN1171_c0_g4~~TRINITY_DN1171_c0_g4_i1.p1  ORF type:complete len:696 (-),score=92.99 TRINITY_DN1171_c0_g4_i1:159-2246(-)